MLKCRNTELQQATAELSMEALGCYAIPFVRDTWASFNEPHPGADYAAPVAPT